METRPLTLQVNYNNSLVKIEKKLLHYTGKAIHEYNLIQSGDRVLVCLSGGKDSFTLLKLLQILQSRSKIKFEIFALTVNQMQPGWDDSNLIAYLNAEKIAFEILDRDTYSIVTSKIPANKTYCSLCSRLRRGIIYNYAKENKFNKIALGHHRDDLIQSLLMSIFYNGEIKSMPIKLLSDDKQNIVIRPLAYCQEKDIRQYASLHGFPIIPCNLCGNQENLARKRIRGLIDKLAKDEPKIPSNILNSLTKVSPSQLLDNKLWDFNNLEINRFATENYEP